MRSAGVTGVRHFAAMAAALVLASCGDSKPAALPPPPPPPPKLVIPARPVPPDHASPLLQTPAILPNGLRSSVNRNITPAQTTWNLRSAYNVAALNCHAPEHAEIVPGYRAFLKEQARGLSATNRKVDSEFRQKYGTKFIAPRETYMTEVYNHFASPPTLSAFCDAMLAVSKDAKAVKPNELDAFSARSLPSVEIVFDDFYKRYDQYRADLADWTAKYGPLLPPQSVPLPPITRPVVLPPVLPPEVPVAK